MKEIYKSEKKRKVFRIVSIKGNHDYSHIKDYEKEFEADRLFIIELANGTSTIQWPFAFEDQLAMLECVINNIILSKERKRVIKLFKDKLDDLTNPDIKKDTKQIKF